MTKTARLTVLAPLLLLSALPLAARDQPMLGSEAPEFRLESLDGETVALSDYRGKHVVLHFGAGW